MATEAGAWRIPGKEGFELFRSRFSRFLGFLNPPAQPIPTQELVIEQPTVVEPAVEVVEASSAPQEIKSPLQLWTEKTHSNPFSLKSRVGPTAPIERGRVVIRESGQMIEIDGDSKKVSLVGKDGKRPLGVTIYELSRKDLE